VNSAFSVTDSEPIAKLRRDLSDRGAMACNELATTNEPLGRCMNYTTQILASALDAIALDDASALKKEVIQAAKLSASIPAILAHAGRIEVPSGSSAVDVACVTVWDAIRADIAAVANAVPAIERAEDRVLALTKCAPLWPGEVPAWVTQ